MLIAPCWVLHPSNWREGMLDVSSPVSTPALVVGVLFFFFLFLFLNNKQDKGHP